MPRIAPAHKPAEKAIHVERPLHQHENLQSGQTTPIDHVMYLQRTIGNQAVLRLLNSGVLQAKLRINQPNDIYEREADQVADRVMRMSDADSHVQRKCSCGGTPGPSGECEECRKKREIATLQRVPTRATAVSGVPPIVHEVLRSPGQPLDLSTRAFMEPRFGHDFSEVRVHTDAHAAESAEAVNALAYTVGRDVVFGERQYALGTNQSQRLLAHELAHVVQQCSVDNQSTSCLHTASDMLSRQARSDKIKELMQNYLNAVKQSNWQEAAELLNAFNREDILAKLKNLKSEQIKVLHEGAVNNPRVGPQSQVALLTRDAETMLGEKLVAEFPSGVAVAFYDANLPEAERRAKDWAAEQNAIGFKSTKISADQIVFDKAIPDTLQLPSTLVALGGVLSAATAKVLPLPASTDSSKTASPSKINILAIFSHGTSNWCGLGRGITDSNAKAIVKSIAPVVSPNLKVILYSCSAARGPSEREDWQKGTLEGGGAESLAGKMRNALVEAGIAQGEVWGHTTVAHVTRNFALRFFTAVSGTGQGGFAYAGFYVWGANERSILLQQLQQTVAMKGYIVDNKTSKGFFARASNETQKLMYDCYAEANQKLDYNGKNLAEMAPLHPEEVARVIHDHWDKHYWTTQKKEKIADKLIRDAKLSKVK